MVKEKNRFHCCRHPGLAHQAVVRLLIFSLTWLVLTDFDRASWVIGLPAILFAVGLSLVLAPASRWPLSAKGVSLFIPFFLWQSTLGGIDVMRRALAPRLSINPGMLPYVTFLPEGGPRILFVNTISLLPGTLSAQLLGNTVTIHTIDTTLPTILHIKDLELRVAALFALRPQRGEA